MIIQKEITLSPKPMGFHLITNEILKEIPEIKDVKTGLLNLFIKHTSASLSINENADPDVRSDLEKHFNKIAPENAPYYDHTSEGSDDMPSHIKVALIGSSLTLPITNGELNFGTWQGIYLGEHRRGNRRRKIIITIFT
ncbi:MAG TPA: secondary thiamine-phosphate synthase enzyme YjbQ [Ignavibacteriaceae bacterium]|nr:secondary thiamine-phosphate synthase enzyme YjbQ [Ignavibacteriaceae bacterium]